MADPNDFIAPLAATGSQGLLRNALVLRVIYAIADDENPQDFEALDSGTGAMPIGLGYAGRLFWLDAADTTTAHDGVSCIVTDDGYRYKTEDVVGRPLSVLTRATTAQPGSPSIGDAYLIPAGASGADWASKPDYIGIYTARGWAFVAPEMGPILYVEDEDGYYHYDSAGDWVPGLGASAIPDGTVPPSALIGGRTHWVIVNQTTNTPPTVSDGVAYIVGGSPTGAWSGQTGKIANRENGAWVFYTPIEGYEVYDQDTNSNYVYRSGWVSKASGYAAVAEATPVNSTSISTTGSGTYSYSATTAPTTSNGTRWQDTMTLSFAAGNPSAEIEIEYRANVAFTLSATSSGVSSSRGSASLSFVAALFVDSETSARDWVKIGGWSIQGLPADVATVTLSADPFVLVNFRTAVTDSSSHTYKIILYFVTASYNGSVTLGAATRRRLAIRERAA